MSVVVSYPYVVSTSNLFQGEPHLEGLRIRVRDIVLARDQGAARRKKSPPPSTLICRSLKSTVPWPISRTTELKSSKQQIASGRQSSNSARTRHSS
jgi:hypothetical protein